MSVIEIIFSPPALKRMLQDLVDDMSTLVQVMTIRIANHEIIIALISKRNKCSLFMLIKSSLYGLQIASQYFADNSPASFSGLFEPAS